MFAVIDSKVPIYSRINRSIQHALEQLGETCILIKSESIAELIHTVENTRFKAIFVTNDFSELNHKVPSTSKFVFEYSNSPLLFIHHDSSFCIPADIDYSLSKIRALKSVANRSLHFVIEESNILFYSKIDVPVKLVHHFSEFNSIYTKSTSRSSHSISFVGHISPHSCHYVIADPTLKYQFIEHYWRRINRTDFEIQKNFMYMVEKFISKGIFPAVGEHYQTPRLQFEDPSGELQRCGYLQAMMHEFTKLSLPARGDYIRLIPNERVVIFGGDPSRGRVEGAQLNETHVEYRPHSSTNQTLDVYQNSLISLNWHSLQFDSAYNNRIVDVFLGGGFCLTDFKSRLLEVTDYTDFFTFRTPSEFCEKIEFLQTASGKRQIDEITPLISEDFRRKCTYGVVLSEILSEWRMHFAASLP